MPDGSRRRVLGRCLRQAGFDVSFAASRAEVEEGAAGSDPANLLVADSALPPDGLLDSVESIRASAERPDLPVVVLAEDGELKSLRDESAAYSRVAVTSRDAPADHLLFLGNELMRPDVQNLRASPRILHSAICAFRPAGAIQPAYGLSYNLSREGLYIRTLEPPAPGTVLWFELKPPHHDTAVHLRGRVVWSRGLRSPGGAAPPGFGLRTDEESTPPADLQSYRDGYQAQRDELRLT
jgi:CheY-like chemotaxis protein